MAYAQVSRRERSKRIAEEKKKHQKKHYQKYTLEMKQKSKKYRETVYKERGITNQYRFKINRQLTNMQLEMTPDELIAYVRDKGELIK